MFSPFLKMFTIDPILTYVCNFLVSLKGLYDSSMFISETEFFDSVGEIVFFWLHETCHVSMRPHYGKNFSGSHMEISRNLGRDFLG